MSNFMRRTSKTRWIIVSIFILTVLTLGIASAAPNAPSDLTVSVPSSGTVTLQWSDNSNNETAFYIYYNGGQSYFTASANSTSLTESGLGCGTQNFYVYAYNANNTADAWSSPSNMVTADPCVPNSDPDPEPTGEGVTPWQSNENGTLTTGINGWNYAMGYHFTPQTNGTVEQLCGFFNGTKTVRLFNKVSGSQLAQATVSSANNWSCTAITPVSVDTGVTYTVAVYLAGSGAARYTSIQSFPQTYGDIRIESSTYIGTTNNPNARPINNVPSAMYGMADILFVPGNGGTNPDPGNTGSCDPLYGTVNVTLEDYFSYTSQSGDTINVSICTSDAYQAAAYNGNVNAAMQDIREKAEQTDDALFALLGSGFTNAVSGSSDEDLTIALYANEQEYNTAYNSGSGVYISHQENTTYHDNTIYIYDRVPIPTSGDPIFPLTISHEFVHYLLMRYVISGDLSGDLTYVDPNDDVSIIYYPQWMNEGVAEYVGYDVAFGSPYDAFTQFYSNWNKCNFTYETMLEGLFHGYPDSTALLYYMFSVKNINTNAFFQYMKGQLLDGEYNHQAGDYLVVTNYLSSIGITSDGFEAWRTAEFDSPDNSLNTCDQSSLPPGGGGRPTCPDGAVCLYDGNEMVEVNSSNSWQLLNNISGENWRDRVDGLVNKSTKTITLYSFEQGYHSNPSTITPGTDIPDLGSFNDIADYILFPQ